VSLFNVGYIVEDPEGKTRRGNIPVSAGSTMVARTWVCVMLIRYCPSSRFKITGVEEYPSSSDVEKSEHGFFCRGGSCDRPGITPGSQG
jgi:hypothetical protein